MANVISNCLINVKRLPGLPTGDAGGHEAGDVSVDHCAQDVTREVGAAVGRGGWQGAKVDPEGRDTAKPAQDVRRQYGGPILNIDINCF